MPQRRSLMRGRIGGSCGVGLINLIIRSKITLRDGLAFRVFNVLCSLPHNPCVLQMIPRNVWLHKNGMQLMQWPIGEVENLRWRQVYLRNAPLKKGNMVQVKGVTAAQADVKITFHISSLKIAEAFDPTWIDAERLCRKMDSTVQGGIRPFGLLILGSSKLEKYTAVYFCVFRNKHKPVVLMCNGGPSSIEELKPCAQLVVNLSESSSTPPKQINEIKDFLLTARRKDARSVKIKRNKDVVKFKVRCSKYLYTLCIYDTEKADKLKQSLPPGSKMVSSGIMKMVTLTPCWNLSSVGGDRRSGEGSGRIDGLMWYKDIGGHHVNGEFSMAVIQVNALLEDMSQLESGPLSSHELGPRGTFVGVYDGHKGPETSRYINDHMFKNLKSALFLKLALFELNIYVTKLFNLMINNRASRNVSTCYPQSFFSLAVVRKQWHNKPQLASVGSCCLVAIICDRLLYVANTGDSRVVLGRSEKVAQEVRAIQLSTEHNASTESVRDELYALHPNDSQIMYNCFLLMPVVDKLSLLLREDLEYAFENDLDSVFDITHLRHSLGQKKRDLEVELKRVQKLKEKFRQIHEQLSSVSAQSVPSAEADLNPKK
ncbi:hypothetical protein GIB67_039829 [Kingdonia uniflora]|uniref:PPM-type phosphatase domain-containing protein n=1 Tax=Kingdonia uniflora TaxID=39325 RepID=A0A7J7P3Y2_9MAGN|nr:hypothetical protein GIB67_039829 [Kingdonia uniflora]